MWVYIVLSVFLCVMAGSLGFVLGYKRCAKFAKGKIRELSNAAESARIRASYLNSFCKINDDHINIADFFILNEIHTIAIYGYGIVGKRLEKELADKGMQVAFAVDQNFAKKDSPISIYSLDDELPKYDVMVVTAGNADDIRKRVGGNRNTVIELRDVFDVVYEM